MDIQATKTEQALVVTIEGSVDALTAESASRSLNELLEAGWSRFVLDLGHVDFMSSAGIRVILDALKKSRQQGGDLCLASAQDGVFRSLEISGLTRVLKTFPTVDEATDGFSL
jgi:anti-sigma B factor antagonist